ATAAADAEIPAQSPAGEQAVESAGAAPAKPRRRTRRPAAAKAEQASADQSASAEDSAPRTPRRRTRKAAQAAPAEAE
ncbi:ATP-dependent helicase, partial [Streptomyces diastaticus]